MKDTLEVIFGVVLYILTFCLQLFLSALPIAIAALIVLKVLNVI